MKILNQLNKLGNSLKERLRKYITISPESKQLILEPKAVLLLCKQATTKVDQLISLEPDVREGLIAVVQHKQIRVKAHFTPEKIVVKGNMIEGKLKLLNKPDIETDSLIYRPLILIWKTVLGGNIDNQMLPERMRIEGNTIYYEFPKEQLPLVDALFHNIKYESALNLSLIEGKLLLESDISINWSDFNIKELIRIFS